MKKSDVKDTAELIGIAAIVASLVFVGWQMKQDREIALAATYQERTTATVGATIALANNPVGLAFEIKASHGKSPDEPIPAGLIDIPEGAPIITFREFYSALYESAAFWFLWDNSHYQHESGYLPEDHWERIQVMMRSGLQKGSVSRFLFENNIDSFRKSFRDEAVAIMTSVDAESETGGE